MNIASNPSVKAELENLQLQFPNKSILTLDDYTILYGISRRSACQHLKRRNIPSTKEGKNVYISTLDLAVHRAKCKAGNNALILNPINQKDEMNRRRGFNQMAERRQLG